MKLRGRRERNLTVNLKRDQFSEAYLNRPEAGLQLLFQWFASLKPCPNVKWTRVSVNELLCKFVQDMFDASTPYYLVVHAILAFEKSYPQFHKKLRPTWNSVRTWKLRLDISLRVPIPPQILHAVVLFCIASGRGKNMATLEHYIQEAAATTMLTSLDVKSEDLLTALIGNLHMLEGPPVQPWYCLFSRDSQFRRLRNLRKP